MCEKNCTFVTEVFSRLQNLQVWEDGVFIREEETLTSFLKNLK